MAKRTGLPAQAGELRWVLQKIGKPVYWLIYSSLWSLSKIKPPKRGKTKVIYRRPTKISKNILIAFGLSFLFLLICLFAYLLIAFLGVAPMDESLS